MFRSMDKFKGVFSELFFQSRKTSNMKSVRFKNMFALNEH